MLAAITGGAWLGGALAEKAEAGTQDLPFLGEIRMFAGDFEPYGWRFCDGRMLDPLVYDALFSLIGTMYGGDGETTFALPDLRGRAPMHASTVVQQGEWGGQETVTLISQQIPAHSHAMIGSSALGHANDPAGLVPARNSFGAPHYGPSTSTALAGAALALTGGTQPHQNMMPSLTVNFVICIQDGIYPSQT